jgi:class 3 adenylate cyclase
MAGFFLVQVLSGYALFHKAWRDFAIINEKATLTLLPLLAPAAVIFLIWISSPVGKAVRALEQGREISPEELHAAKTRVLNIPYLAALMNIALWLIPSVALPMFSYSAGPRTWSELGPHMVYNFTNALMITLLAFILLQNACRVRIIPILFPDGKIQEQAGAAHMSVRSRFLLLYTAICLLPMFQITLIINTTRTGGAQYSQTMSIIESFQNFTFILFIFIAAYGLWLSWLFARNLSKPIHKIIHTTERIRSGDLDARTQVYSNDEVGLLGDRVNHMAAGLKENQRLKEVFDLFASPEISVEILSREELRGGEVREVTLLFSDLRGFTTLSEELSPQEVVHTINSYFEAMSEAIVSCGGIVLQYVGDEIEAVFGAPVDDPNHADKAVSAALAMRSALNRLNRDRKELGLAPLAHGVGAHTGKALAGIVGSRRKISYAMVGDTVNLASRIQELNKQVGGDILISGETYRALTVPRKVKGPLKVCVTGKSQDVEVFRLLT